MFTLWTKQVREKSDFPLSWGGGEKLPCSCIVGAQYKWAPKTTAWFLTVPEEFTSAILRWEAKNNRYKTAIYLVS